MDIAARKHCGIYRTERAERFGAAWSNGSSNIQRIDSHATANPGFEIAVAKHRCGNMNGSNLRKIVDCSHLDRIASKLDRIGTAACKIQPFKISVFRKIVHNSPGSRIAEIELRAGSRSNASYPVLRMGQITVGNPSLVDERFFAVCRY